MKVRRAALFLVAMAALLPASAARAATTRSVSIQNFAYHDGGNCVAAGGDQVSVVQAGDTVHWVQCDSPASGGPHTVTADDKSFDSGNLQVAQTYDHVFTRPGSYPYHCTIHPSMTGTVVVEGTPVTTTTRTATTRAGATTTTARAATTTSTAAGATTTTFGTATSGGPVTVSSTDGTGQASGGKSGGGGGSGAGAVAGIIAALLAVAGGGGFLLWRLRPR